MPYVSVTRLQLRSFFFVPLFILKNSPVNKQIMRAPGFLRGKLLVDSDWTFWTISVWSGKESMLAFRNSSSHLKAMPKLADWAKQASIVHWEQETKECPSWEAAHTALITKGRASKVKHPSPQHLAGLACPLPKVDAWRETALNPGTLP